MGPITSWPQQPVRRPSYPSGTRSDPLRDKTQRNGQMRERSPTTETQATAWCANAQRSRHARNRHRAKRLFAKRGIPMARAHHRMRTLNGKQKGDQMSEMKSHHLTFRYHRDICSSSLPMGLPLALPHEASLTSLAIRICI